VAGGWLNLRCGVSLTDVSPDSSYVNGFSTDVALFDTLEIQYIIHLPVDKKLLPGVISPPSHCVTQHCEPTTRDCETMNSRARPTYGAVYPGVSLDSIDDDDDDDDDRGDRARRRPRASSRWLFAVVTMTTLVGAVALASSTRAGVRSREDSGSTSARGASTTRGAVPFEIPKDVDAAIAALRDWRWDADEDEEAALGAELPNGAGVLVSHRGGLNATLRRIARIVERARGEGEKRVREDGELECRVRAVMDDGGFDASPRQPDEGKLLHKLHRAQRLDESALKGHEAASAARVSARLGVSDVGALGGSAQNFAKWVSGASKVNTEVSNSKILSEEFCWKESYGRGVGKIPSECPGQRSYGAFCYDHCSKFGSDFYTFEADCHQHCHSSHDDHGLLCHKGNWGRGWGESFCEWFDDASLGLPKKSVRKSPNKHALLGFFDWFEQAANDVADVVTGEKYLVCGGRACPSHLEGCLALCYPRCPSSQPVEIGCNLCGIDCDNHYGGGIAPSCMKKTRLSPGMSTKSCEHGYEMDAGLCYKPCAVGFTGVGPVCWGDAPPNWVNCGMGAAIDDGACAKTVADQILGPLEIVAFVATLGTSSTVTAATKTQKLSKLQQSTKALKSHLKDVARDPQSADSAAAAISDLESAETDTDKARAAAALLSVVDPTGVSSTVAAYTFDTCDKVHQRSWNGACDETVRGWRGENYRGCQTKTKSGRTCQPWNSQSPQTHSYYRPGPQYDTGDHNYCRNPDGSGVGLWCYTTDPNVRWEYCDPLARTCDETVRGSNEIGYRGCQTVTKGGRTCQPWNSQLPHTHSYYRPGSQYDAGVHNYCRNPDGSGGGLWCYTTDPNVRWEYCDPLPARTCDETVRGSNEIGYRGCQTVTKGGRTCQPWNSQSPHTHSYYRPGSQYDAGDHNYCRNPDGSGVGLWCYTTDPNVRWQYCDPIR